MVWPIKNFRTFGLPIITKTDQIMTTVKVMFRLPGDGTERGTVYYQIARGRMVRRIATPYRITGAEWERRRSLPAAHSSAYAARSAETDMILNAVRRGHARLLRIIEGLEGRGVSYTPDDVADEYGRYYSRYSFPGYLMTVASIIAAEGHERTAETYRAAAASFGRFAGCEGIVIDCLTSAIVRRYESWMLARGLARNTTSFYMRILRAAYNRAVAEGAVTQRWPFRGVYTGVEKTRKRVLSARCMRRLREMDLADRPALAYARDMFMLSFYLRGMSFIDLAFLRRDDLKRGYVTYRRRKTGQLLAVRWTREMQAIVDRYGNRADSPYLVPIITDAGADPLRTYRNRAYMINRNLKRLAAMAGCDIPLTMHCARHSWATVARRVGVPLGVISQGMGHRSETTTRIYLDSIDTSVVDRANARVIASLG